MLPLSHERSQISMTIVLVHYGRRLSWDHEPVGRHIGFNIASILIAQDSGPIFG